MGDQRRPDVKRVRLTGARFKGGRLPIDSLVELQSYQQVVRIAAEAEWRQEHPGEDLPDGFLESVTLTIERLDEGSADVFMAFEQQQQAYVEYQREAEDAADAYLVAAYSNEPLPDLPALAIDGDRELREAITLIGSTLRADQTIEFYPGGPDSIPVSITVESRPAAVERLSRVEDFLVADDSPPPSQRPAKADESLVGRVTALDADKKSFNLVLPDGRDVHGWYREHPELLEDFREVVNSTSEGPLTRISGLLSYKNGEPYRWWEISSIERVAFDDTSWGARLATFAALSSGWDGQDAAQISSVALDAAQVLLQHVADVDEQHLGVFPTDEGGVLVEWSRPAGVRSVEILVDGSFELFSLQQGQQEAVHEETADLLRAVAFVESERLS